MNCCIDVSKLQSSCYIYPQVHIHALEHIQCRLKFHEDILMRLA